MSQVRGINPVDCMLPKGKRIAFPGKGSQQYPLLVKALADAG